MEHWTFQPGALDGIGGGVLYYPCAGDDWATFLRSFWDCVGEFAFCDLDYDLDRVSAAQAGFCVAHAELTGAARARVPPAPDGGHRDVDPGQLVQQVERPHGGPPRRVRFRRGFGQYGLWELPEDTVSIFVHRRDSQGEAGSNAWFLWDRPRDHAPVSNLFSTLVTRLRDPCLVVTDGSNTRHPVLGRFNRQAVDGREAMEALGGEAFESGGFRWRCVGHGGPGYGPTLVWRLTREGD